MPNWNRINKYIEKAWKKDNPYKHLKELRESFPNDGHLAFNLGKAAMEEGKLDKAFSYFKEAEEQYPKSEFKKKARNKIKEVSNLLEKESNIKKSSDDVLYIVSCTKTKIWDEEPDAPRFVPAKDAYRGSSFSSAKKKLGNKGDAKWVVLSARYGFIEPEHPISNYDVKFGDLNSGPVSETTLKQQARNQKRFEENKPLSDFHEIYVLGNKVYKRKTKDAFEGTDATIMEW
ncbi:DUF6884 domain-containing protein [Methanonatronarchaeum sp. AMET-Sl]|uniref:tetratricopeptide repeat protein n=1 Tax=Methanonatronarchaeum sp. AMET-Sl TaxID=3037654 RepID=UPI00244E566F|nr:DUF6884 domain-containing protein [Methanonatronarchaeum sp. AMET-Sl]WGI17143.1 hypothetical protein QEN48_06485 [Methanonatronarchaeum sp. AMET-Sl]